MYSLTILIILFIVIVAKSQHVSNINLQNASTIAKQNWQKTLDYIDSMANSMANSNTYNELQQNASTIAKQNWQKTLDFIDSAAHTIARTRRQQYLCLSHMIRDIYLKCEYTHVIIGCMYIFFAYICYLLWSYKYTDDFNVRYDDEDVLLLKYDENGYDIQDIVDEDNDKDNDKDIDKDNDNNGSSGNESSDTGSGNESSDTGSDDGGDTVMNTTEEQVINFFNFQKLHHIGEIKEFLKELNDKSLIRMKSFKYPIGSIPYSPRLSCTCTRVKNTFTYIISNGLNYYCTVIFYCTPRNFKKIQKL